MSPGSSPGEGGIPKVITGAPKVLKVLIGVRASIFVIGLITLARPGPVHRLG